MPAGEHQQRRELLTHLVSLWRRTRSARVAELVDVLWATLEPDEELAPLDTSGTSTRADARFIIRAGQGRSEELPMLAARVTDTRNSKQAQARLDALPDDPRLGAALLSILDEPPFSARTTQPFWRALLARLEALEDARHADALAELGANYGARIRGNMGAWLGKRIAATAEALAALPDAREPLSDEEHARVEALEAELATALAMRKRSGARARADKQREEELIAAVRAAPDAEGPRLVYMDWLLSRGDPFGDALASEAAGEPFELPESARARTLGELARVVSEVRYARGFPVLISLWRDKSLLSSSVGCEAWATVEELRVPSWASTEARTNRVLRKLVTHPCMRSLRALQGPNPTQMVGLLTQWKPEQRARLEAWAPRGPRTLDELSSVVACMRQLPGLRVLDLMWTLIDRPTLAPIFARASKLEGLTLTCPGSPVPLLERLDDTELEWLWWRNALRKPGRPALFTRGRDGRLSRVAIALCHTQPKSKPYPTESILELLASLEGRPLEVFAQIPLTSSPPRFAHLEPPPDHVPPDDARAQIQAALGERDGSLEFDTRAIEQLD